ncbi:acetyltransferase [bacterium]|nr:acetyltransferase [bacterium]
MQKNVYIFGAGGMAREVADIIRDMPEDYKTIGFVDKDSLNKGQALNDSIILGSIDDIKNDKLEGSYFSCGFGEIDIKKRSALEAANIGLKAISLIHPSVIKTPFVQIGEGSIVCAGSVITNNVIIGKHTIININATIGHDSVVGDFCTVSPGCHISGRVTIGNECYIGTGAVILPNLKVGNNSVVGAGAVVTKDVPQGVTVIGIPAKVLEK